MTPSARSASAPLPRWVRVGLCAPLLAAACRAPAVAPQAMPAAASSPPKARHRHTLQVDVALAEADRRLDVRMCFPTPPPRRLRARRARTVAALVHTSPALSRTTHPSTLVLPRTLPDGCVSYALDVDHLGGRRVQSPGAHGADDTFLLRSSDWLLRPDPLPGGAPSFTFRLAPGQTVSTPWDRARGPSPTVFRWLSYVVFGHADVRTLDVEGGVVEVALLGGPYRDGGAPVLTLVRDAALALAEVHGGLPRDHVQVTVFPVEGSRSVYFGKVVRGGGPGVHLLINPRAPYADMASSWTVFHELQHVGMPFVSDPWMSEGFASYYTELERTRRGHRSEVEGWRRLEAAFERGRRRGRGLTLQATSDHMHGLFAYQRVYWGGAALALLMDVELRRATEGRLGLDDAMRDLGPLLGRPSQISAAQILRRWDAWSGTTLFTDIARSHLHARSYPDVTAAYRWLGVRVRGDTVTLDDQAPGAAMRRAIMAPRTATPPRDPPRQARSGPVGAAR